MHLRIKKLLALSSSKASTKLRLRKAFLKKAEDAPSELNEKLNELQEKLNVGKITYDEDGNVNSKSKETKIPEETINKLQKKLDYLKQKKKLTPEDLANLEEEIEETIPSWHKSCSFVQKINQLYLIKLKPCFVVSSSRLNIDQLEELVKTLGNDYFYLKSNQKSFKNLNNIRPDVLGVDKGSIRLIAKNQEITKSTIEKINQILSKKDSNWAKGQKDKLMIYKDLKRNNQNERGKLGLVSAQGNLIVDGFEHLSYLNGNCFKVGNSKDGPYGVIQVNPSSIVYKGGGSDENFNIDVEEGFKEVTAPQNKNTPNGENFFIVKKNNLKFNILKKPENDSSEFNLISKLDYSEIKDPNSEGIFDVEINNLSKLNKKQIEENKIFPLEDDLKNKILQEIKDNEEINLNIKVDENGTVIQLPKYLDSPSTEVSDAKYTEEELKEKEKIISDIKLKKKEIKDEEEINKDEEGKIKESDKLRVLRYELKNLEKELKEKFGLILDEKGEEKTGEEENKKREEYKKERASLIKAVKEEKCLYCQIEQFTNEKREIKTIYNFKRILNDKFEKTAKIEIQKNTNKLKISSLSLKFLKLAEENSEKKEHPYLKFLKEIAAKTSDDFKEMIKKNELGGKLYEINKIIADLLNKVSLVKKASTKLKLATFNKKALKLDPLPNKENKTLLLNYFAENFPNIVIKNDKGGYEIEDDKIPSLLKYVTTGVDHYLAYETFKEDFIETLKQKTIESIKKKNILDKTPDKSKKNNPIKKITLANKSNVFKCTLEYNESEIKNMEDDKIKELLFADSGLDKFFEDNKNLSIIDQIDKFKPKNSKEFKLTLKLKRKKENIYKKIFNPPPKGTEEYDWYQYLSISEGETVSSQTSKIIIKLPETLVDLFEETRDKFFNSEGKFFFCEEHLRNYIRNKDKEKIDTYIKVITEDINEGYKTWKTLK